MKSAQVALLAALFYTKAAYSLAINSKGDFVLHEHVDHLPREWKLHGEALAKEPVTLRVALPHLSKDYIEAAQQVSDPASISYGQYLSADQLRQVLPDTSLAEEQVLSWLHSHAVADHSTGQGWVEFTTDISTAKSMLNADFSLYSYLDGEPVVRTERYSLPKHLVEHVDFIYPTVHFFDHSQTPKKVLSPRQHIPTGPANCSTATCPILLKNKYHINYTPKDSNSGSKIGITGFIGNFPDQTDYRSFLAKYANHSSPASYQTLVVNGGTTKAANEALTVEALLDVDYSTAFTGHLNATFFTTGGAAAALSQPGNVPVAASKSGNEAFLEFFEYLLAEKSPPQVISISYSDDEQTVPIKYATRVCDLLAQAAARGISIIGASGDGGASGSGGNTNCYNSAKQRRFVPTFPSSCPWITSVGATASYGGAASYSSGGMSNYFARPSWQNTSVASYITELKGEHKGYYNTTGRGIPDVSLLGDDYLVVTAGEPSTHDGTSASTPVFAAMIALLNDIRLRANKPVLGFLNPLLYSAKLNSVYTDVVSGQSIGCSEDNFFETGWEALKGWDAATGLGEPDFAKLRALTT